MNECTAGTVRRRSAGRRAENAISNDREDTSTSEPGPDDDADDEANASLDTDSSDYDSEDGNESVGSRERVPEAVVLVSGGTDSATAVYDAMERSYDPCFCHISYGQRTAAKEAACARRLADIVDAPDFPGIDAESLAQVGGSSLTDRDIEVADADLDSETIPSSYVPFRNANPLAMATPKRALRRRCSSGHTRRTSRGILTVDRPSSTLFRT